MIDVDPSSPTPLWAQIEAAVRDHVASRRLLPDAAVPSVRDLARRLAINPATVAKAYQRLVADGVLIVRRGEGTFVAPAPPTLTTDARREKLRGAAHDYAVVAISLGASSSEARDLFEERFDELDRR